MPNNNDSTDGMEGKIFQRIWAMNKKKRKTSHHATFLVDSFRKRGPVLAGNLLRKLCKAFMLSFMHKAMKPVLE